MVFTNPSVFVTTPNTSGDSDALNIYATGYDSTALLGLPMTENGGLVRAYFSIDANLTGTWDISIDKDNTTLYGYDSSNQGSFSPMQYNAVNGRITVLGGASAVPAPAALVGGLPLMGILVAIKFARRRKTN